ncbi:MAG: hypothetical protein IT175_13430 [Acidobacteria bacterium]|nr:hypothetical protein [Acidobacteriota bacterium]
MAVWDVYTAASRVPRTSSISAASPASQTDQAYRALDRGMQLSARAAALAVIEADRHSTASLFVTRVLLEHR